MVEMAFTFLRLQVRTASVVPWILPLAKLIQPKRWHPGGDVEMNAAGASKAVHDHDMGFVVTPGPTHGAENAEMLLRQVGSRSSCAHECKKAMQKFIFSEVYSLLRTHSHWNRKYF